jgi:uncharacterized protein YecE (DUF72 family)
MPTKVFRSDEIDGFFSLLPHKLGSRSVRHVFEPRHESFRDPAYFALAKKHKISTVFADSDDYPCLDERTGDVAYARLMRTRPRLKTGYSSTDLDGWADRARGWRDSKRDVFAFFINGAKERAPAAAQALLQRLRDER